MRATPPVTPLISVVAPCHNEEEVLPEFVRRTRAACEGVAGDAFEIVLVDDGSRDATWSLIQSLAAEDPRVVGVRLMRNHGHQLAATAGLSVAGGERILLIDADLQDPPELLGDMAALMDEGADVVYGRRRRREGETAFKLATAALFYRLLSRMTAIHIPPDTGDFRLMSRRVVEALLLMPERDRFVRGMVSWIGGRQVALDYDRKARHAGESKYPLGKMIGFAIDAVTSFSTAPLRLAAWTGVAAAGVAGVLIVYTLVSWAQGGVAPGWSSLMGAIAGFSAVQLIVLAIMGEYIGRLVQEAKGRPLFLIEGLAVDEGFRLLPVDFCRLSAGERRRALASLRPQDPRQVDLAATAAA